MRHFVKTAILLLIIVFLSQCRDYSSGPATETEVPSFQHQFNSEAFADVIPYKFSVNWEQGKKGYSQQLGSTYYEYSVRWETDFNPDALAERHPNRLTYNIIAVPNGTETTFYVLKFLEPGNEQTPDLVWSDLDDSYTGRIYLMNQQDERVIAQQYSKGELQGEVSEISKW